jgi:hypothetical protein
MQNFNNILNDYIIMNLLLMLLLVFLLTTGHRQISIASKQTNNRIELI